MPYGIPPRTLPAGQTLPPATASKRLGPRGRSDASQRGWSVFLFLESTQDVRVLLLDLFDAAQHALGREVLGHAIEHRLALAHGPLLQRRPKAAQRGQRRREDGGADQHLLHLGPFRCWTCAPGQYTAAMSFLGRVLMPNGTYKGHTPMAPVTISHRPKAATTTPAMLASSPPSSHTLTAISTIPATTRMVRSTGPSFFANIFDHLSSNEFFDSASDC